MQSSHALNSLANNQSCLMNRLLSLFIVVLLSACSDSPGKKTDTREAPPAAIVTEQPVVVLGGPTTPEFVKGLQAAGVPKTRDLSTADLAQKASALNTASVAIILVDATEGPLPRTREDILISRQFCRGAVLVAFSKSALVEDAELIDLEVLELRDLLNKYDYPGETTLIGLDSESARTNLPKGYTAIAALIAKMPPANPRQAVQPAKEFTTGIYVLSDMEAFKRGIARPIGSETYPLILGDQVANATIQTAQPVQTAKGAQVTVTFLEPVNLAPDDRFVIGAEDHVIAAGSFKAIVR